MAWGFMKREGIIERRLSCKNCGSEDLEIKPKLMTQGHNETEPDGWSVHYICNTCGHRGTFPSLYTYIKDREPFVPITP